MKVDVVALYQRSLLGGLGGLVGWLLVTLLVPVDSGTVLRTLMTGALIGLALGACCGAYEGLFRERSPKRVMRGSAVGGGIGLIGGIVGLVIGEFIFAIAGGGLFSRAIGWGVFGGLIGTNEGVSRKMPQKAAFGAYGGFLGGLFGGSTYQFLATGASRWLGFSRDSGLAIGGAVGLVLLGMFIGCLIGLVEDLLRSAWLLFFSGKYEGQTRTLDPSKRVTTLGRSELTDICLLGDPEIAAEHAKIVVDGGKFVLEPVGGEVLAGAQGKLQSVQSYSLAPGDFIQIGSVRARFQSGGATS